MQQQREKKLIFWVFLLFFSSSCHSIHFENTKYNSESTLFYQLLKLIWECGISFSSRTYKNCQKCSRCRTINFVQGLREAQAVWKPTFSSHHSIDFKRKKRYSKPTLFNQHLNLIWECGLSLSAGAFKNGKKCAGCWTIN